LSFAQFEREVTGERIRDKIAASKRKGMWMGGLVPLGYEIRDRQLVINPSGAETVRHIFQRYCQLRSVRVLREELDRDGIRSKLRVAKNGIKSGGMCFARGSVVHAPAKSNLCRRGPAQENPVSGPASADS
jgi:site-specific DNA recombinase